MGAVSLCHAPGAYCVLNWQPFKADHFPTYKSDGKGKNLGP
jgi:hypothetical protein